MKKSLITLMALAGVALAESVTLSSYYTSDGVNYNAVESFNGLTQAQVGQLISKADNLGAAKWTITLNTADLLLSDTSVKTGTSLVLDSFVFVSRAKGDDIQGVGSVTTITINNQVYTSDAQLYNRSGDRYGLSSYSFANNAPTFKYGDTLTFVVSGADNSVLETPPAQKDYSTIGMGSFQGLSGAPKVYGDWQGAFQLTASVVQADPSTPSIPEPATATLSLLALAGLAARRRRK